MCVSVQFSGSVVSVYIYAHIYFDFSFLPHDILFL